MSLSDLRCLKFENNFRLNDYKNVDAALRLYMFLNVLTRKVKLVFVYASYDIIKTQQAETGSTLYKHCYATQMNK